MCVCVMRGVSMRKGVDEGKRGDDMRGREERR